MSDIVCLGMNVASLHAPNIQSLDPALSSHASSRRSERSAQQCYEPRMKLMSCNACELYALRSTYLPCHCPI